MRPPRWAVFLSGRGSNAEAFWEHLGELDVRICVCSKQNAYGRLRARRLGIPILVLDRNINWKKLDENLRQRGVDQIFLLGFMKMVPAEFVEAWAHQIWNLHPSLLPDFPGVDSIEKSFEHGGRMGVTVHEVTADMDAGPRILQHQISARGRDQFSLEEAKTRISIAEQRLVRNWAERRKWQWT